MEEHNNRRTCLLVLMPFVSLGWRNITPEQIKQEALQVTKDFRVPEIELCVNNTSLEHLTKNTIRHRVNTKPTWETQVVGNVTVCGDASHPMTPNLGQGGCMAMEDAIILARKLHQALKSKESQNSNLLQSDHIHQALLDFHQERYKRTYALTQRAAMIGARWETESAIQSFFRDWVFLPLGVHMGNFMEHTLFDVGKLPIEEPRIT
jgi:2-polyprenyl-6-methoxyphenol hydroxylase-like FAD-dependent oxidoreductase